MSKRSSQEKEIEKARVERQWKTLVHLVNAFNIKQTTTAFTPEEWELFQRLHLGEAELETIIEANNHGVSKDDLKQAYERLEPALKQADALKNKQPQLYVDAHLLMSKYHFTVENHEACVAMMEQLEMSSAMEDTAGASPRTTHLYAEALLCKAISLEKLSLVDTEELVKCYERASEVALSAIVEDQNRSDCNFLKKAILLPPQKFLSDGFVTRALERYRMLLKSIEVKTTIELRKLICQRLAEVLMAFISGHEYTSPCADDNTSPPHSQPKLSTLEYTPSVQAEEVILVLLLNLSKQFSQSASHKGDCRHQVNETTYIFDLLTMVLSKTNHHSLLSQTLEKGTQLVFAEYHLLYQFALSLMCAKKYQRAYLVMKQCHQMQPSNSQPLLLTVKLCVNHLNKYREGLEFSTKLLDVSEDNRAKGVAYLASGVCYHHLACQATSTSEYRTYLQKSIEDLNRARGLDSKDIEVLYHLAINQAFSKQLRTAIATVKAGLAIDCFHLPSLHLFVLLLSSEKKYEEALEVLETAITEYPSEISLLLTKVKLLEAVSGSQVALPVCHQMLALWNKLYHVNEPTTDETYSVIDFAEVPPKIPSGKLDKISMKKVTMADSTSIAKDNMDDGTESIATSIQYEKTLSEAASGTYVSIVGNGPPVAIALLSRLWLVTAECFINMGDETQASSCLLEASTKFPISPDVLYFRGRLKELQGDKKEARSCYESALAVHPKHVSTSQRLAMLYHEDGELSLAEETLRSCILHDSTNHTAWNDLGTVLESCKQYTESAQCFMTSLQLESTTPVIPFATLPRLFRQ